MKLPLNGTTKLSIINPLFLLIVCIADVLCDGENIKSCTITCGQLQNPHIETEHSFFR